jgi:prepilin-type N-terminal cleavage/methylation domain-containing protein
VNQRHGFTLLEVMVALVITGMVALTAYAALDAGIATRGRIDGSLRARADGLVARAMLDNAMRHMVEHGDGEALVADGGTGGDVLTFYSRGVTEPFGGSTLWRVQVRGATIGATSIDRAAPSLTSDLPGVQVIRVSTLAPDGWHTGAVPGGQSPQALRVEFVPVAGQTAMAPLIVALPAAFVR